MKIRRLSVKSFRPFRSLQLDIPDAGIVIRGANGAGKSSLLEAIGYLALGRSIRGAPDRDVIKEGGGGFLVAGSFRDDERALEVSLEVRSGEKRALLDGNPVERLADMVGEVGVVHVDAESISIIRGGPEHRRRFLDVTLCQVDHTYLRTLQDYRRTLRVRNKILQDIRKGAPPGDLGVWTQQLARLGAEISRVRNRCVDELSDVAQERYEALGGRPGAARWIYRPSGDTSSQEAFSRALEAGLSRDRSMGFTTMGPHRDDIQVKLGGRVARRGASYGETKTLLLAWVSAQADWIEKQSGRPPILLLDDLAGELDACHREGLASAVPPQSQVIVADPEGVEFPRSLAHLSTFQVPLQ